MNARAAVVGLIVVTVSACSVRGGSPAPPSEPPAATDAPAAPDLTSLPSAASSAPAIETPPVFSPPGQPADVPIASLVVDGQRYPGEIGGYTFGRITSSAPWLPAFALDRVTIPAGAQLSVEIDDRATIDKWVARYAAAGDTAAFVITGLGEATSPTAQFHAPPPGDHVLSVVVTYGGGAGNGAYYWHVVVE